MKLISVFLLLSLAVAVFAIEQQWKQFKDKNKRAYSLREEPIRRGLFAQSKALVESHNSNPRSTFKLTLNRFSDMTGAEKQRYLGATIRPKLKPRDSLMNEEGEERRGHHHHHHNHHNHHHHHHHHHRNRTTTVSPNVTTTTNAPVTTTTNAPVTTTTLAPVTTPTTAAPANQLDHRTDSSSCIGPIKDQGQCGSCWAFAAIASYEYSFCRLHGNTYVSFSEQELVDCTYPGEDSCLRGGWPTEAWDVIKAKGVEVTANYPYTSGVSQHSGTCNINPALATGQLNSYTSLPANDVPAMMQALNNNLITVALFVNNLFQLYSGGIYNDLTCPTDRSSVNHGIVLVGYGTDATTGLKYWIGRNQWGTSWGEAGYIRMVRGVNMCNIETFPLIVTAV